MVCAFATLGTDYSEHTLVQREEDLTPTQRQALMELVDQFADVFSTTPGMMQLVHHKIKTHLGVLVRQQPYHVLEAAVRLLRRKLSECSKTAPLKSPPASGPAPS